MKRLNLTHFDAFALSHARMDIDQNVFRAYHAEIVRTDKVRY